MFVRRPEMGLHLEEQETGRRLLSVPVGSGDGEQTSFEMRSPPLLGDVGVERGHRETDRRKEG